LGRTGTQANYHHIKTFLYTCIINARVIVLACLMTINYARYGQWPVAMDMPVYMANILCHCRTSFMAAGGGWYALAGLLMKPVHRDPRTMMNMAIVPARGS
jgi:hypothetical protein